MARKATKRALQPLGDRIVVRPVKREEVSPGGVILPDTALERPQEGEVVAAGPGKLLEDGKRQTMDVKTGDRVVYARYAGTEFKVDEEELVILRETDVLAKRS